MSLLFIVSSPSGGGKTTICNGLLERDPNIRRAITCTTRPPRPHEVNGQDYYFLSDEEFHRRLKRGEFLESASIHGHFYGSPRKDVETSLSQGRDVLLAIDVQGAAAVRQLAQKHNVLHQALVDIFLLPSSLEVLEKRLKKRGTDSPESIRARLVVAREEIKHASEYQHIITSGSIEDDIAALQAIVESERRKRTA